MKNVCLVWKNMKLRYNPFMTSLQEFVGDYYLNSTGEDGSVLPDDEWTLETEGGAVLLEGREEIEAETGVLDVNGKWETYIVCSFDRCNQEALEAIYEYYEGGGTHIDEELTAAVLERFGLKRVTKVIAREVSRDENDYIVRILMEARYEGGHELLRYEVLDGNFYEAVKALYKQARDAGLDYVSLRKAMEEEEGLCDIVCY